MRGKSDKFWKHYDTYGEDSKAVRRLLTQPRSPTIFWLVCSISGHARPVHKQVRTKNANQNVRPYLVWAHLRPAMPKGGCCRARTPLHQECRQGCLRMMCYVYAWDARRQQQWPWWGAPKTHTPAPEGPTNRPSDTRSKTTHFFWDCALCTGKAHLKAFRTHPY